MTKKEYKEVLFEALDAKLDKLSFDEKMMHVEKLLIEYQQAHEDKRDTSNRGKAWTDEELKVVLSDAPSKYNCLKYAKIFRRKYGSIEQIYRWSTTTDKDIQESRPDDKFVLQVKRIAKELGLRG